MPKYQQMTQVIQSLLRLPRPRKQTSKREARSQKAPEGESHDKSLLNHYYLGSRQQAINHIKLHVVVSHSHPTEGAQIVIPKCPPPFALQEVAEGGHFTALFSHKGKSQASQLCALLHTTRPSTHFLPRAASPRRPLWFACSYLVRLSTC